MDLIAYGEKMNNTGFAEFQDELREIGQYMVYLLGNTTFTTSEYEQNSKTYQW